MVISNKLSDEAVLAELGARVARERLQQNRTQEQVSGDAGVSKRTVETLEAGGAVRLVSFLRVLRSLGLLGGLNTVVAEPVPSPLELLKAERGRRVRASGKRVRESSSNGWQWGE